MGETEAGWFAAARRALPLGAALPFQLSSQGQSVRISGIHTSYRDGARSQSQSPTPPPSAAHAAPASESHASSKPTDLGSSRSLRPKLTQPCPNIRSRSDPTPAYQERTPHLPMTTPSKINRFITTQLFNLSKTSCPYGKKTQPTPWPVPPSHAPQKGCGSVTVFQSRFLHPSRSTRLCQPLPPVLLSPLWPPPYGPR